MATDPLVLGDAPLSVVSDEQSDAGQLQSSVQQWCREASDQIRKLKSQVSALQTAAPAAAAPTSFPSSSTSQASSQDGDSGWSPVFALVQNAGTIILQVVSWTGGSGTPPDSGVYVGPTGFVTSPAQAVNLAAASGGSLGGVTMRFLFSAGVAAPPSTGDVLFDNATFGSIANVYVSTTDRNGVDVSALLGTIGTGAVIQVFLEGSQTFASFSVTGATSHTGYIGFAVTPLSGVVLTDLQPTGFSFAK